MEVPSGIAPALAALAGILERDRARGLETFLLSEAGAAGLHGMPARFRELRASETRAVETRGSAATHPAAPDRFGSPAFTPTERTEEWCRQQLNAIFFQVKGAPEPRALGTLFETVVFATGNPCAEIVFVGEAPGSEEEKQRKPFVGPAGQKLDQIVKAMGLSREQVYISNIVKFRPKMGDGRFQGTRNRPPTQEEMACCLPYIRAEIEVVRPRVIVALGRTAAEGLLEKGGAIAAFRQAAHQFAGIPVVVTYHPSYLLRQEAASPEEGRQAKRAVWEDMLLAMELAGLPVSERQRTYFQ